MFGNYSYAVKRKMALYTSASLLVVAAAPHVAHAEAPPEERLEEIVVSGAYEGRKLGETILGATVMRKEDIMRQLDGSLGETLKHQPGMSSTFFGPGASRPIIRGLGGDRIRVLDAGIGSIDASSTSPDHAVAVEPALAERIEILRGTAMLMYGSSAAGGVVNVFDGRIPTYVPEDDVEGGFRYSHSTVDDGDEVTGAVNARVASLGSTDLVVHGDAMYRKTDDYKIPGFSESAAFRALEEAEHEGEDEELEEEHEETFGIAENTATETKGGSVGASMVFDNGFIGMNVRKLDSQYGVPGHSHAHEEEDGAAGEEGHAGEEEFVSIDLDQVRFDLNGEIETDLGWFRKAKMRFAYADYKHTELEGEKIGTVFKNKGWEGRLDLAEKGGETWKGSTGFQVKRRDFSAIGDEAFVPATVGTQAGIYTVKDFTLGRWQLDVGGRYEHTKYEVDANPADDRSFDGFSLSAGAGYDLTDSAFVGVSVFRTERAPSTEELFSNGPHLATNAYELGDKELELETALGIEATYTYSTEAFSFVLNGYLTNYDDFIYERVTGEEEDGLEVFAFTANDARLYGFEAKAEYHVGTYKTETVGEIDLHVDAQADMVRAELKGVAGNDNLPRIPPFSALFGIEARADLFDIRTELEYEAAQNRTTAHELPTDDYLLWNAYLTLRPFDNKDLAFELRGTNLGNVEARQHTSFLKDLVPLPGRNLKVSFRAAF
ncbi:TonB-dependent receptor [Kordiimonas aestuarii]|uniref:TonB-dependent receptor n=1 Tax=Kordiimonas aestuarii TaxID=1005925 RepID=UPI0021CFB047|nr:TonB-dependent receptor [Kordiimonas aestuarii]